ALGRRAATRGAGRRRDRQAGAGRGRRADCGVGQRFGREADGDPGRAGRPGNGVRRRHPRPRGDAAGRPGPFPPPRGARGRDEGRPRLVGDRRVRPYPVATQGAAAVPGAPRRDLGAGRGGDDHPAMSETAELTRTGLVEVRALFKTYRRGPEQVHALQGVSFSLGPGEVVTLFGPSGAGKTVLLSLGAGAECEYVGEV